MRQIANRDTEIETIGVDLLGGEVHAVGVVLPSIETESDLDIAQLAETEG